ncbi:metal-dependent transcriptional regulator [Dysosmobacter sp.]|jgi:Mn-dependent DtxR family transcriptional regulator|uniref:metal-dependent transcriptional regulator n=1 Tax=Dysosmobacter sp. TaxID=2591382 RepID=UPI003D9233A3
MDITQTNLRYLLAVYELMGSNAGVAAVEVSRRMGVSKPSVTRMLGVLAKRGLLVKEPYGKVRLTERGALLAQEYAACVDMVQRRLPRLEFSLTDSETVELACVLAAALPSHVRSMLCAWK